MNCPLKCLRTNSILYIDRVAEKNNLTIQMLWPWYIEGRQDWLVCKINLLLKSMFDYLHTLNIFFINLLRKVSAPFHNTSLTFLFQSITLYNVWVIILKKYIYIVVKLRLKKWLNHASMKKETESWNIWSGNY